MISFQLTPEQEALQHLTRRFAQQEIVPVAAEYDRSGQDPWHVVQKAHEVGLLNESIPSEYGGGGRGVTDACLIAEEISAGCAAMATNFMANTLATNPIVLSGTGEQKEHFLTPFTASTQMAAFCLTEPSGGSDVAAMQTATEYAKNRQQFGVPIGNHQAIQFMLADMATDIEAARLLAWQSAWLADHGQRQTQESSIAKLFATDMCMRATTDAVQIFGGYGYMTEFPVEKYMRDAKLLQIYEGTNQIQRQVIARHMLGA